MADFGASNRTKNTAARFALEMGKRPRFAGGGGVNEPVVTGALHGIDGGRTDTLPISVPPGSYVVPSDVVSGLPSAQGNSLAGHVALTKLMESLPLLPDESPYGASFPKLPKGKTIPGIVPQHHLMNASLGESKGGKVDGKDNEPIPIMAAGGEHVVVPEYVRRLGLGNLERGHRILDEFVKEVRKRNIKELQKLPGPVKDGTK